MEIEILAKRMPMYADEKQLVPMDEEAPVWTPVQLVIYVPPGIGIWKILGGFHADCIVRIPTEEKDVFMTPSLQGGEAGMHPYA